MHLYHFLFGFLLPDSSGSKGFDWIPSKWMLSYFDRDTDQQQIFCLRTLAHVKILFFCFITNFNLHIVLFNSFFNLTVLAILEAHKVKAKSSPGLMRNY